MTVAVVGAHVGVHAVYLGRLVGGNGRVYAFEPWLANYDELVTNARLNQMQLVVSVSLALSDQTGVAVMVEGGSSGRYALAAEEPVAGGRVVRRSTLDRTVGDAHVDLLLVDTEGHELNVLRGGESLIEQCRPAIVLENHGREGTLIRWLTARGYAVERAKGHLMAMPRV